MNTPLNMNISSRLVPALSSWFTLVLILQTTGFALAADHSPTDDSIRTDADKAVVRAIAWLRTQQTEDGQFGSNSPPAATAMILHALDGLGVKDTSMLTRARKFVEGFLANSSPDSVQHRFNADVCRRILHLPDPAEQTNTAARDWTTAIAQQDRDNSVRSREFDLYQIEWQYQRAQLVEQGRDPDQFVAEQLAQTIVPSSTCQTDEASKTAFQQRITASRKVRRSYGDMSYGGALALVHDRVSSLDPRVDSMMDWAERAWSLDSTPRGGTAGLFFFYQAMTKCLDAAHEEEVILLHGNTRIRWREEVMSKLCALQRLNPAKDAGYWVNDNSAYMEGDRVLATAYVLLAIRNTVGLGQGATQ